MGLRRGRGVSHDAGRKPHRATSATVAKGDHGPASRMGAPKDIAQAVLMTATNPFLPGATLDMGGGAHPAR